MSFELFDPSGELAISQGHLPHWFQKGVTYFITFRTNDSVPADLANDWHGRRLAWFQQQGVSVANEGLKMALARLPENLQTEYHSTFTREFMGYLDRGHGTCVLRAPEYARIVADALLHFDRKRYLMGDFVVMPNHVHLLVCLMNQTDVEGQCYSWKKFSAGKINKLLGTSGRFWQEESFDHLVRNPKQFVALRRYIAENPEKANLKEGEYVHYVFDREPDRQR